MSALDEVGADRAGLRARHARSSTRRRPCRGRRRLLKWYDIAEGERPIPRDITALAHEALDEIAGQHALAGELGFVILHRCGESFYFLLVSTWRNENELWETVRAKAGEHEPAFGPWPLGARAPPDVLRLGAARGLPRAGGLEPLPALARDASQKEYRRPTLGATASTAGPAADGVAAGELGEERRADRARRAPAARARGRRRSATSPTCSSEPGSASSTSVASSPTLRAACSRGPCRQARDVGRRSGRRRGAPRSCARARPGSCARSPQHVSLPVWQAGPRGTHAVEQRVAVAVGADARRRRARCRSSRPSPTARRASGSRTRRGRVASVRSTASRLAQASIRTSPVRGVLADAGDEPVAVVGAALRDRRSSHRQPARAAGRLRLLDRVRAVMEDRGRERGLGAGLERVGEMLRAARRRPRRRRARRRSRRASRTSSRS